jgi:hypothetical protein
VVDPADVGALQSALEQNNVSIRKSNWFPFLHFSDLVKLIDNMGF